MANTIKVRRGTKASMPTLAIGELGLATDTYELFVGTSAGNKPVSGFLADAAYLLASADSRLSNARTIAAGSSITITDGGPGGSLTINTVQDIRTTDTPTFASLTLDSNGQTNVTLFVYSDASQPVIFSKRARGTKSSPSAVQAGNELLAIVGQGYHSGGAFSNTVASMRFVAAENFTPTAQGSYIYFETTPTGSATRVERLRIESSGTIYAWYPLGIIVDSASGHCVIRSHANGYFSVLFFDRTRGTKSAPTAVQANDVLGGMQFRGYDGSSYGLGSFIYGYAAETFTTTAHGGYISFFTTPTGSTSYSERMRINHDGVVYIYSTADPCLSLSGGLKIGSLTGVLFASSGTVSALAATAGSQYLRRNSGNTAYEWATLTASDLPAHATRHESGGADAITGNLDANARVGVRINTGATTYKRRRINFVAGSGISLSMSDDSANEEVDLTIAATGGGGGAPSDATYLTWATPPTSLSAARLVITRNPIVVNKDTDGEYKLSAMIPIASETAAYTLETVTLLFSSMVANDAYSRWGKESHIAWAVYKSTGSTEVFAGAEQVTGTLSYVGMDATTTPDNILTWDAATSRFRTVNTADQTAYVQVDLGATYSGYCFVKFRFGVYSSGTARARLYTSTDGSSWNFVTEWTHTTSTGAYVIYAHYTGGARYIRLTLWKESGSYAFFGATYTTASINKIFFFRQGEKDTLSDYMASYAALQIDGSVASSDPARRGILSLANYGPSTTAPSMPSGLSWDMSVCVH